MGKYIIKLKPLAPYFFGGEVTFGDGSNQNYLVKSNVLPQPSALLGLVRYEVLRCNGLLSYSSDKKSEVDKLIGSKGFDIESPAEAYGAIKSISPIFITDGNLYYTPMPMDFNHNVSFNSKNRCCYSQDTTKSTPIIDKFSWKTFETYKYWIGNNNKKVESDAIFQFIDQVGITKNNANDNKEKAFFKQTLIDFKDNYQFVFTADVDDSNFGNDTSVIVPFGGNRSMFEMTIEKIDDNFDWCQIFYNLHRDGRLLALGDAYLTNDERNVCQFIWGINTPLKYMTRAENNGHNWRKPNKSQLFHLQSRGSVIFADEEQLNKIKSESNFNKVGLNLFV
jgi:CRISPR type III-B/RAMP module-associated protein Cmr3